MRRAVVSVISNFVEGYHKKSPKEKDHFLEMAMTSLHEVDVQGEISFKLNYWSTDSYQLFANKLGEVAYLLYRYRSKLPV